MKYTVKVNGEPSQTFDTAREALVAVAWCPETTYAKHRSSHDTVSVTLDDGNNLGAICGDERIVEWALRAILRETERQTDAPENLNPIQRNLKQLLDSIGVKHGL